MVANLFGDISITALINSEGCFTVWTDYFFHNIKISYFVFIDLSFFKFELLTIS